MDITIVPSPMIKSYYKIIFNIKPAMCTDTTDLLAYVKTELFLAYICYYIKNQS